MKYKLLPSGKLDDTSTQSEYERGYIDCYNKYYMDIWGNCLIYDDEWKLLSKTYELYKDIEH